jgi:hypothetical protein
LTDGSTGETISSFMLSNDPFDLCVSDKKDDGYSKHEVRDIHYLIQGVGFNHRTTTAGSGIFTDKQE